MNDATHTDPTPAALRPELLAWCAQNLHAATSLRVTPLRVEASNRQFYRLAQAADHTAVLMVSPPELERNAQFLKLARVFASHDVPVPRILAVEEGRGWVLMQDLGSRDLAAAYTKQRDAALTAAIDQLPVLAAVQDPLIEPYDRARFEMELGIFDEWFAAGLLADAGAPVEQSACTELLLEDILKQPLGCVHRDYHCRNLLFNEGELGIVDFQDALRGPILYDIASLLRDCYFTFSETEIDRWFNYFLSQVPAASKLSAPKRSFDFVAIQRQLKAIGIFARLHLRDGKSSHLPHILPVLRRLVDLTGAYAELGALHVQLEGCVKPAAARLATV